MTRKYTLISAILILAIGVLLYANKQSLRGYYIKSNITSSDYYQACLNNFEEIDFNNGNVLFLGNSLMVELDLTSLQNSNIRKLAIRGDLSNGLRNRLEFIDNHLPKQVFIELGLNDILNGIPFTINEHKRFVEKLKTKSPSTEIFIHSITPTLLDKSVFINPRSINEQIITANNELHEFCIEERINYINLYDSLEIDGHLNPKYTYDGVHFTEEGNTIWLNILQPLVDNN